LGDATGDALTKVAYVQRYVFPLNVSNLSVALNSPEHFFGTYGIHIV
jgi:hypothetical protein